jgi:SpoVK/Ycf46/Vps4 family AAA+-type ATPase
LESQKETLTQIASQFRQGSRSVPKGVLLAGPPGNGKSFSFLWFVSLLGLPGLIIRNLFCKWVGESERNLARLIDVIAALAPCVILIDEIDLFGVGSRREVGEHDGGTAGRMGQRFLEWAGSESLRGQVILFGASNRPGRLDAALRDRFPCLIPYLHPATKDLPKLFAGLAQSMHRQFAKDVQLEFVSASPHLGQPTIRGLADIVAQAGMRADQKSGTVGTVIQHQHLLAAAQDWKPTHDPLEHEFLALKAVQLTSFSSMLPWMSQQGRRPDAEIPEYLRDFLNPAGEVNQGKLGERIRCLEQTLCAQKLLS